MDLISLSGLDGKARKGKGMERRQERKERKEMERKGKERKGEDVISIDGVHMMSASLKGGRQ